MSSSVVGWVARQGLKLFMLLMAAAAAGCAGAPLHTEQPGGQEPALSSQQLLEVAAELERRGDSLRAEQYLMEALDRGAPADVVLPRLVAAYVRDRQYRLAALRAEEYLRTHPSSSRVRLLLAALYQAISDYPRAIAQYRAVVQGDPAHADAHFALASVLLEQGQDRADADAHFRHYLELAPEGAFAERAQAALLAEVRP